MNDLPIFNPNDPEGVIVRSAPEADGHKFPEFGLVVQVWMDDDGAVVVQIDGAHDSDPDCERLRVYLNEARARSWEQA